MSDTGPADTRRRISLRTTRMEAFSDGVFAIAATLLVLDLAIPAVTSKNVGHQLAEQWPTYVAYPTHMLAEYVSNEGDERIAVTVYGLNLLAISAFIAIIWHYALWQRLVTKDNTEDDVRALTKKLDPSLASYAVVIGLGLWQPKVAVVLYFIIALFMIIPFRAVLQEARRRRRS